MDIYKEVTDRIMAQLENGIIPWQKPWIASGNAVSHVTGNSYSLLNQMLLGRPGEYVTFAQCQKEGGKVKLTVTIDTLETALLWLRRMVEDALSTEEKEIV